MRENSYAVMVNEVSVAYKNADRPALYQIDVRIKPGEVVGIMGPSGAGKTTLGLILNGVIPHFIAGAMSGKVKICGKDSQKHETRELAHYIGVVPQDFETQLVTASIEEEIALGLRDRALSLDEIQRRVEKYVKFAGLD